MDEKLFFPRLDDLVVKCEKTNIPQFLGFLSETETAMARSYLANNFVKVRFFGGFDGAIRNYVCVLPSWCDDVEFPIIPITFEYKSAYKLTHRDFLGAVMSLGIIREKVGDILVGNGTCVLFAQREIAKFIISQTQKIGNVGVNAFEGIKGELPISTKKQSLVDTIPSARLDAVVSAICNLSRNKASEIIESNLVCVNSFICEKTTKKINSGDVISVRKFGRFDITSVDDISKKGRIILKYEKHI